MDGLATGTHHGELSQWVGRGHDLLVLTDGRRQGRDALSMPFRDAVVVEASDGGKVDVERAFDVVIIDRESLDQGSLARALRQLGPVLRPEVAVAVVLDGGALHDEPHDPDLDRLGFRFDGLATLNGKACAIVRRDQDRDRNRDRNRGEDAIPISHLLAVASASVALAPTRGATDTLDEVVRLLAERRRSEHALLAHLERAVAQIDQERRNHRGLRLVRTVLRRSRSGRVVLRVGRPVWHRVARPLWHRAYRRRRGR